MGKVSIIDIVIPRPNASCATEIPFGRCDVQAHCEMVDVVSSKHLDCRAGKAVIGFERVKARRRYLLFAIDFAFCILHLQLFAVRMNAKWFGSPGFISPHCVVGFFIRLFAVIRSVNKR